MLHDVLFALWFLLPAGAANVAPVFAAHIPALKKYSSPIDGGIRWHGHRLLGSHKTWRGIIAGLIAATFVFCIQQDLYLVTNWGYFLANGVNYGALPWFLFGPALAIGALGGDALESFFKRQRGIKAGKPWYIFDQIDYVLGAIVMSLIFVRLNILEYVYMIVVWVAIHFLASYIGWLTKLKDAPI